MARNLLLATTAFAIGATLSALPASADQIDRRQARQSDRIEQGIRSGSLTPREAAQLRQQQAYIRDLERKYERDGRLSPQERARLNAALDAANRSIYREKHDAQSRWSGRGWFGRRHSENAPGNRPWYRRWY
ncbi:MAG: hypothetical protein AB7E80_13505 [Hyphomicrobiaceae bacterium]